MTEEELRKGLEAILEKGFDQSFVEYCAATFSSFTYPADKLAMARMHAFALRAFMVHYVHGIPLADVIPGNQAEVCLKVGNKAADAALARTDSNAGLFCREYVSNWCAAMSNSK